MLLGTIWESSTLLFINYIYLDETIYSKTDQVQFVKDSLEVIC